MGFGVVWAELLYRPIFNILVVLLAIFGGNMGIAIIVLTLLVRLLLLKNSLAGANMSQGMSNMQPKMEALQEKYKDDPKKLSEETMKLLKKEGAGPMKGCVAMLIQLPVFIGLYFVVRHFAEGNLPADWLYSFFYSFGNGFFESIGDGLVIPHNIDSIFFGIDLLKPQSLIMVVLVAVLNFTQFGLTSLTQKANKPAAMPGGLAMPDMSKMMWIMNIMMTFTMAWIVRMQPAGVGLYLMVTSLFSVVQYLIQYRVLLKAKWDMFFHKDRPVVVDKK